MWWSRFEKYLMLWCALSIHYSLIVVFMYQNYLLIMTVIFYVAITERFQNLGSSGFPQSSPLVLK